MRRSFVRATGRSRLSEKRNGTTLFLPEASRMNIGFVGVGRMGANMARRLKDRGYHVTTVFDVNRAAATALATELGCAACQTLGDVTAGADVVFTIVTDDAAMR